MPVIYVEMLEGRTSEQKERLAASLTAAFVQEAGGKAQSVQVIYREVPPGDWAVGGRLLSAPAS